MPAPAAQCSSDRHKHACPLSLRGKVLPAAESYCIHAQDDVHAPLAPHSPLPGVWYTYGVQERGDAVTDVLLELAALLTAMPCASACCLTCPVCMCGVLHM